MREIERSMCLLHSTISKVRDLRRRMILLWLSSRPGRSKTCIGVSSSPCHPAEWMCWTTSTLVLSKKPNDHDGWGRGFESRVSWFGAGVQIGIVTRIDSGVDRIGVVPIK